ncbi:MAG TPA: hypothetical protein VGQ76_25345 [Thermoanaerobaculia bacterium]|jgi:hypothetical protein|nr:hypothetical protein [Thermoanaerobaculia bacterium]
MPHDPLSELLDLERWLGESRAEAERLLPRRHDLSGPLLSQELSRELERRPELRPGILQLLLAMAQHAAERSPIALTS